MASSSSSSSSKGKKKDQKSPVWALLGSLKSRNPQGPSIAHQVDRSMGLPAETRREAVVDFLASMDKLIEAGVRDGDRLFDQLARRGNRSKIADSFIADCSAKRVLDPKNSNAAMEAAAKSARNSLLVADSAMRKAEKAAKELGIALVRAGA